MSNYSDNIRRVRKLLHLSQEQAADELGISLSAYGKFERGDVKLFNDTLTGLAKLSNMSEVEILAGGRIEGTRETGLSISYAEDEKIAALRAEYERRLAEVIRERDEYQASLMNLIKMIGK